ncbi:MAG TPA: hypothetical protein PLH46_03265 [Caldisericia bacterium]|nr:hypothetical protein [Caldisericia bacterium]
MNESQLKRMEQLLKGDFSDFEYKEPKQIVQESEEIDIPDIVEEPKTIVESLFESFGKYESLSLNESDSDLVEKLNISDELYAIQEALDSIKEKVLDESVSDIIASSPALLPIIAGGIATAIGWYTKRKAGGDSAIPRPVVNTLYAINQYVKGGKEAERREIIKNSVLRANPNLDKKDVDNAITLAIKNSDKLAAMKLPQGKAKYGTYETDFMKAQKERDRLKLAK